MSWSKSGKLRRHLIGIVGLLALGSLLSGCGFQPLYGERNTAVLDQLSAILVKAQPDDLGRDIQFGLEDKLHSDGRDTYVLVLKHKRTVRNIAVETDQEVTRKNVHLTVDFDLRDRSNGTQLYKSSAFTIVGYNQVDSQFANILASRDADQRAAQAVVQDIHAQLGIYFQRTMKN